MHPRTSCPMGNPVWLSFFQGLCSKAKTPAGPRAVWDIPTGGKCRQGWTWKPGPAEPQSRAFTSCHGLSMLYLDSQTSASRNPSSIPFPQQSVSASAPVPGGPWTSSQTIRQSHRASPPATSLSEWSVWNAAHSPTHWGLPPPAPPASP